MGDRDAEHTLSELQEARAEIDRLRDLLRRRDSYLMERLVKLEDLLRWRDSRNEPPNEPGNYLVITNEFYGGQSVEILHWNGGWPLETFRYRVEYWRPIGPLPGEGGE